MNALMHEIIFMQSKNRLIMKKKIDDQWTTNEIMNAVDEWYELLNNGVDFDVKDYIMKTRKSLVNFIQRE